MKYHFPHRIIQFCRNVFLLLALALIFPWIGHSQAIPLEEHPRPDYQRPLWLNMNGYWDWQADSLNIGEQQNWQDPDLKFEKKILVPFSWTSCLSEVVKPEVNIAWYSQTLKFDPMNDWKGKQIYLVFGAVDFHAKVWLNGKLLGEHHGGYTPFEFNISSFLKKGVNNIKVRVEDIYKEDRPRGKQEYGDVKGIWQTVYLEGRDKNYIQYLHFVPDIDNEQVEIQVHLSRKLEKATDFILKGRNNNLYFKEVLTQGKQDFIFTLRIPDPVLWELNRPYLYEMDACLDSKTLKDQVSTYFGMRKISTMKIPGKEFTYITLNNEPLYMKLTLDQAFHPQGFYTYPTDRFMKDEIQRAKDLGLNGVRVHIKTEIPRKLYWADKMGILVMADIPNFQGNPTAQARANWEYNAVQQIERDFNHPAIFSWVLFNETWGLFTKNGDEKIYLPETQEWVADWYHKVKDLDPTRLVEDNSPCNNDHVITDLNTWHAYAPARLWGETLDYIVNATYPGSEYNFIGGNKQTAVPMFNSECGAVWGYQGSTGDIDIMWEYHIMINEFRKRPQISGFLFTEFHDVLNEWNGYYRYDRSGKDFGLGELCPGMTVNDLHQDIIPVIGDDFYKEYEAGQAVEVPLYISAVSNQIPSKLSVTYKLYGWNSMGEYREYQHGEMQVSAEPFVCKRNPSVKIHLPAERTLLILSAELKDNNGIIISRNFLPMNVKGRNILPKNAVSIELLPDSYSSAAWSIEHMAPQQGKKIWGMGTGYFEYTIILPDTIRPENIASIEFIGELAARYPQSKYLDNRAEKEYVFNPANTDPGYSKNSYPMTDEVKFPSTVKITFDEKTVSTFKLPDDPADHRGILSWLIQIPGSPWFLDEAGSYGFLTRAGIDGAEVMPLLKDRQMKIRLAVEQSNETSGGLSVYGEKSGRYPLNPAIRLYLKQ